MVGTVHLEREAGPRRNLRSRSLSPMGGGRRASNSEVRAFWDMRDMRGSTVSQSLLSRKRGLCRSGPIPIDTRYSEVKGEGPCTARPYRSNTVRVASVCVSDYPLTKHLVEVQVSGPGVWISLDDARASSILETSAA